MESPAPAQTRDPTPYFFSTVTFTCFQHGQMMDWVSISELIGFALVHAGVLAQGLGLMLTLHLRIDCQMFCYQDHTAGSWCLLMSDLHLVYM